MTALGSAAAAIAFLALGPAPALAQTFPARSLTFVAATAAGGPGDTAARLIGERMATALGQTVVIENVAGAGGMVGMTRVARADPDGYTLLVHQTGIVFASVVSGNQTFNLERDLTTVGLINTSNNVLVGRRSLPAQDMKALVAWMTEPARRVRFGHPGAGTLGHLSTLVLARSAKAQIDAVPYRGIAPAVTDLLGEHVDLVWLGAVTTAPLVADGKIKAYAVGGGKRIATIPNVPSARELGLPELDMPFWHALFAPAATPRPVVERLAAALRESLADAALLAAYAKTGVEAFPENMRTPEVAHAFVRSEAARWSGIAAAAAAPAHK